MLTPYLRIDGDNAIDANIDLIILDDYTPLLVSLCDIAIINKKVASDFIRQKYLGIKLKYRENIYEERNISIYANDKFRYKSQKMQNNLTHTILYNTKINDYIIDWNNEGKTKIITRYLHNRHYMPVTEEIVDEILKLDDKYEYYSIVHECDVITNNPMFENLKCYKLNVIWFKEELEKLNLFTNKNDFDWDSINDIEDYIFTFIQPIQDKLREKIKVLYDPQNINSGIFNGKKKPLKGQIPVIQSAIEVLKRDRFVYIAAEMGFGKSPTAVKVNHNYFKEKNKNNYVTLIVAPAITLTQWRDEIKDSIGEKVDIKIIKKTTDFINWYNKTNMQVDKPTYILVGKETFKLDSPKRAGINVKTMNLKYKKKVKTDYGYWQPIERIETVRETLSIACCPDCGKPLKNELRKTEDVFFTEKDFRGNPKKSNYKCNNCGAVLWQATYDKTKKTSLIRFINVKNIIFDSVIVDEAHESNNSQSIIGNATRTLFNHAKKIILLTGTPSNGYASSLHNLLLGLISETLKNNEVIDVKDFIRNYGTLIAIQKRKDGEYYRMGRSEIKDSDWQEIEGINPIVFTKYLSRNFIFAELSDLGVDLPELKEKYIGIEHLLEIKENEKKLIDDIKRVNAFNASMYEDTIVKHYINNPYSWETIEIEAGDKGGYVQPINLDKDIILPKEQKLIDIIKQEKQEGRKVWIYTEFTNGGQYMTGENIPNRLERILKQNGFNVYQLKQSISTYDRKDVIDKNKDKYDVFISNPRLVQVGLNLVFCPTYIVYIPSYQVNVISQAIRRGLRANSTQENRIYHLYYKDTVESKTEERYQRKRVESEAIKGKFDIDIENEKIRTASKLGKKINDVISK